MAIGRRSVGDAASLVAATDFMLRRFDALEEPSAVTVTAGGATVTTIQDPSGDHSQFLLIDGSRAMVGDLDMGANDIINLASAQPSTGAALILRDEGAGARFIIQGFNDDLEFLKADGSTISLLWDESDDQWEFRSNLTIFSTAVDFFSSALDLTLSYNDATGTWEFHGDGGTAAMVGTDGSTHIDWVHDGTNRSGLIGNETGGIDRFTVRSERGDLYLNAIDNEGLIGASILLQADDSGGVLRNRYEILGTTGDQRFYKDDGATVSSEWDESQDRWEFHTVAVFEDVLALTITGQIISTDVDLQLIAKTGAGSQDIDMWADDGGGTSRQRFRIIGAGDIQFLKVDGVTLSLLWDETADRWDFGGETIFNANGVLLTPMQEDLDMDEFNIIKLNAAQPAAANPLFLRDEGGSDRFVLQNPDDIEFRKADGTTVSLLWDESDDRWEMSTPLVITDPGVPLTVVGDDTVLTIDFLQDGSNLSGRVGNQATGLDHFYVDSVNGDLFLRSLFTTAAAGAIHLQVDDTAGTLRARLDIVGEGDISFFKVDGSTVSLLWDESDDRWEFSTVVHLNGNNLRGLGELHPHTATALELFDDDNHARILIMTGGNLQFRKDDGAALSLLWDESDDRWEFFTDVDVTSDGAAFHLRGTSSVFQAFYREGTTRTGFFGNTNPASDDLFLVSEEGDLRLKATSAASSDNILLYADQAGVERLRLWINGANDISFYKVDGTTVSLLWDESDDRWEFATPVVITEAATMLVLIGTDAGANYLKFAHDGATESGWIGHADAGGDDFYFRSIRGNVRIYAEDIEDNTGAIILFEADDSGGTRRARARFDGFTGDLSFFKDDGATVSLLWDNSDDRWEFSTVVHLNGNNLRGLGELHPHTATALELFDDDNHARILIMTGGNLQFRKDDGAALSLLWDESDDRWEFFTDVDVTSDGAAFHLRGTSSVFQAFYREGTTRTGFFGNTNPASDDLFLVSEEGDLRLKATSAASSDNILLYADQAGVERLRLWINGANDISFYKVDGTTVSLLWDESDDRWEFATPVVITEAATMLVLIGTDAGANYLKFAHDGATESGWIGHADAGGDDFYFRSIRGNVRIYAEDIEDNTGAIILFEADDSGGTRRARARFDGFTGDLSFFKDDGATVSLLWDESDDRWEFNTPVQITAPAQVLRFLGDDSVLHMDFYQDGVNLSGRLGHTVAANDNLTLQTFRGDVTILAINQETDLGADLLFQSDDATGTIRTRLHILGKGASEGDFEFYSSAGALTLRWDNSDDRWEMSTDLILENTDLRDLANIIGQTVGHLGIQPGSTLRGLLLKDGAGDNRIVLAPTATPDIQFFKAGGSILSLLWDESDDRWEFATQVRIDAPDPLTLFGTDAADHWIQWLHDGTNNSAQIGHPTVSDDLFQVRSLRGQLFITAEDQEDNLGSEIRLSVDDSAGTVRRRMVFNGVGASTGDILFYKNDGTTISLLWDESDDRWEFTDDVSMGGRLVMNGNDIIDVDVINSFDADLFIRATNSGAAGQNLMLQADDSGGTLRTRLRLMGTTGDIEFYKDDGTTISLLWDESQDQWEFGTDVHLLGNSLNGVLSIKNQSGGTFTIEDDTGATRIQLLANANGNIFFTDAAAATTLQWDETDTRWEYRTPVVIDQLSTTAALPVLTLDQADVDEDFFKFIGISDTSVDRALVDAVNFTTPGAIVGWVKVNVQDDQGTDPIVDGDYYIPFYAAPTA